MLTIKDIRDSIIECLPKELFIQRDRDKNIVYSTALTSSPYIKMNFMFTGELVQDLTDTADLKHIIEDGNIQGNHHHGFKYAQDMLEMLSRNNYADEYYHLRNLIEESIAVKIYFKKKNKDLLIKINSTPPYQVYEGSLLNVSSFVQENYDELFNEEMKQVSDSLWKSFEEKNDDPSLGFKKLKNAGLDSAALITYCLAYTASKITFKKEKDRMSNPKIKNITDGLKKDIKDLKKFKSFKHPFDKNSVEAKLAMLYYRSYGILSNKKVRSASIDVSRNVFGRFENVYHKPEIEHEYNQSWNLSSSENRKHVIWAPNGYGKTTFLKSILFSSSTDFMNLDNMNENGKNMLNDLNEFHGLNKSDYLPIYIEAAYYSSIDSRESIQWLYEIAQSQMGLDESQISSEDYLATIEKYNSNNKLIYLIDGYDELEDQYRPEFHKALNKLLSDKQYGSNAIIIVASRPYFEVMNFNGYDKWSIKPISFENNKQDIKKLIYSYTRGGEYSSPEKVFKILSTNYYLKKMITTPEILIDAISGCMDYIDNQESWNSDISEIVEATISDLITRDADAAHATNVDKYGGVKNVKQIYALLAYENIANARGIDAGNFVNELREIIEQLCLENRGNSELAFISNLPNSEIVRLFFTKMSIFEPAGEYIRFMSDVFATHLAAIRTISLLEYKKNDQEIQEIIEVLGAAKFDVFVMLCSLYYYSNTNTTLRDNLLHNIEKATMYFIYNTSESLTNLSQTQKMFKNIIEKKYGKNVISKRKVSEYIISQIENLLLVNIQETSYENRGLGH